MSGVVSGPAGSLHECVVAADTPPPAGPYSHATRAGGTVYLAGHTPVDPRSGLIPATFAEQMQLTLRNLAASAAAAGGSLAHAVRVGVYLASFDDFAEMNELYAAAFPPPQPARTTTEVGLRAFLVEIDAVLWLG